MRNLKGSLRGKRTGGGKLRKKTDSGGHRRLHDIHSIKGNSNQGLNSGLFSKKPLTQ